MKEKGISVSEMIDMAIEYYGIKFKNPADEKKKRHSIREAIVRDLKKQGKWGQKSKGTEVYERKPSTGQTPTYYFDLYTVNNTLYVRLYGYFKKYAGKNIELAEKYREKLLAHMTNFNPSDMQDNMDDEIKPDHGSVTRLIERYMIRAIFEKLYENADIEALEKDLILKQGLELTNGEGTPAHEAAVTKTANYQSIKKYYFENDED